MRPEHDAGVHLDTFPRPLAHAVVSVLRRHGVQAWAKDAGESLPGLDDGQAAVFVPVGARDMAVATMAATMEEIREEAEQTPRLVRPRGLGSARSEIEDEPGPPIVMERIRRMGFIGLLLAPLLVITLAAPGMPMALAIAIYVAGLVALTAFRQRAADDE
jgi:hypothetical protein